VWLAALLMGGAGSEYDEPLRRLLYAGNDPVLGRNAGVLTWIGSFQLLVPVRLLPPSISPFEGGDARPCCC
jgi:hypothetical protein